MTKKAVILLSGGLDSCVSLYIAKKQKFKCHCLIFDYHQRHLREIESARKIAHKAGCIFTIEQVNLPHKGSALLNAHIHIPHAISGRKRAGRDIPVTYVPGRNILFLSFALSFAESKQADAIFIGAHAQDYSGYPDCRPQFYRDFKKVVASGTKSGVEGNPIEICTPLLHKTKSEIIKIGRELGAPLGLSWSCYKGGKRPCGKCESCYYRAKGFKEAGLVDPGLKIK